MRRTELTMRSARFALSVEGVGDRAAGKPKNLLKPPSAIATTTKQSLNTSTCP